MVTGNTLSANAYDYSQQNVVTGSRAINGTVYQNTAGRAMFVVVSISYNTATGVTGTAQTDGYTDSSNPPTTIVSQFALSQGTLAGLSIFEYLTHSFIVLPGNYYKIVTTVNGGATATLNKWTEYT